MMGARKHRARDDEQRGDSHITQRCVVASAHQAFETEFSEFRSTRPQKREKLEMLESLFYSHTLFLRVD